MRFQLVPALAVLALGAALLLGFALMQDAPAGPGVHLGIPTSDPSTAMSVLWHADAPSPDAAVTLWTPEGARTVPAERVPGPSETVVYEARLTDLEPSTTYRYGVEGENFTFTTPPASLGPGGSFTFVALGDMGVTDEARGTVDTVAALDPAFVLHAGDISYAEGDEAVWNRWFALVEPVAAHTPWITALGNHETKPPATEVAAYEQRFALPGDELTYSFDWAGVHFVALDTYSPQAGGREGAIPEPTLAWLEADLAAHEDAPWTVVLLHEPPYSSNSHGSSERVREAFAPLFEAHGVDLVISAHDHGYERTYPLRDGEVVNDAPSTYGEDEGVIYVVTGGAGRRLYDDWATPAPDWSASRDALFHVVEVTVTPDRLEGRVVPTQGGAPGDAFRILDAEAPRA